MSYAQHVRHSRNHRKQRHAQPVYFSTGSGFWPSQAFLDEDYGPYVEDCKVKGVEPMECEASYRQMIAR